MAGVREKYTEDNLKKAVSAVREDGLSFGDAAKIFNIPKATIYKKSLSTIVKKMKPGPAAVLTEDGEKLFENHCIYLAEVGFTPK